MDQPVTISRDLLMQLYRHLKPTADCVRMLETVLYPPEKLTERVERAMRIDIYTSSTPPRR